MNFAGAEHFANSRADLWARLTDMEFVSSVIPDVERIVRTHQSGFTCRVRPRFSFLSGSLELSFELIESTPPERLKVRSRGQGIGAAIVVEAEIELAERGTATELKWTGAIVSREGLLRPVSAGLIQGAAERVIANFWQKFRAAAGADDAPRGQGSLPK